MLKEMKMVEKYPIDAVRIVEMDPFVWIVEMEVPVNSTIQSDTITLNITFGDCYPISPPDIRIVGNPMVWGGMLEQRYFWLDFKTRKQILLFIWVMKKSDKIPNGAIEYMSDLISQFIYSNNFCFQDQWVPTYTTHTVLVYIQALLSNVKLNTPVSYTSFDTDPTDCTITY
jgi:ubiquitin-protein ligase